MVFHPRRSTRGLVGAAEQGRSGKRKERSGTEGDLRQHPKGQLLKAVHRFVPWIAEFSPHPPSPNPTPVTKGPVYGVRKPGLNFKFSFFLAV